MTNESIYGNKYFRFDRFHWREWSLKRSLRLSMSSKCGNREFYPQQCYRFFNWKLSITYLLLDNAAGAITGYFTLTHKAIEIKNDNISNTTRWKRSSHARLNANTNSFTASAFLFAQIGKNYGIDNERRITGDELIRYSDDVMADI